MGKRKRKGNWKDKNPKRMRPAQRKGSAANVLKSLVQLKEAMKEFGQMRPDSFLENELGIQEYINTGEGFHGEVKHRFEDFVVQEVDEEGKIALIDNGDPLSSSETESKLEFLEADVESIATITHVEEGRRIQKYFSETRCGDKNAVLLIHLCYENAKVKYAGEQHTVKQFTADHVILDDGSKAQHVEIFPDFSDENLLKEFKTKRTTVHKWFNEEFSRLTHKTDDNGRIILSRKVMRLKDKRWPKNKPPILKFILQKQGISTTHAIKMIAQRTRISQNNFGYAGNKDKRAITTQWVSAPKAHSISLKKAADEIRGVEVGNFMYCEKEAQLGLGAAQGNHFIITIRNIQGDVNSIERALKSISKTGFINYFGSQRFGVGSVGTHELGKLVFQEKWQLLCALMLTKQPSFNEELNGKIEHFWETGDLRMMQARQMPFGSHVAWFLASEPAGYKPAVCSMVRNQKNLLVHAYQSFIWNQVASERIRRYGLNVIAEDLVLDKETGKVRVVGSDIDKFSKEDIVLPIPGYKMIYPTNLKDYYVELLAKDELTLEDIKENNDGWSTSGDYRNILRKPTDVSWEIVHHQEKEESFIHPLMHGNLSSPSNFKIEPPHTSLVFSFTLRKSSYATMLLRDLMKKEMGKQQLMRSGLNFLKKDGDTAEAAATELKKDAPEAAATN